MQVTASILCGSSHYDTFQAKDNDNALGLLDALHATMAKRDKREVAATYVDVPPSYIADLLLRKDLNFVKQLRPPADNGEQRTCDPCTMRVVRL